MTTPAVRIGDVTNLGNGAYAFIGGDPANAGFVVGRDGVLVIDSQLTPAHGRAMVEQIAQHASVPMRVLFLTHYHGDHVYGSQAFSDRGAVVISHRGTRALLEERGPDMIERSAQQRPELAPLFAELRLVLPTVTFEDRITFHLGGVDVNAHFAGWGHTPYDCVAHVPSARVLYAGDLLFNKGIPVVRDANISQWINLVRYLETIDVDHVIGGHGPAGTRADLGELRVFLERLLERVQAEAARGRSLDEVKAAVPMEEYRRWGRYEALLPPAIEKVYQNLTGR
ncbi:MAG: MBL fold metallo-hydrolase [Armatimonadetes bacterium]|nr:MBL fold metallo-hydrolase [Armatimonadota bacterium]